MKKLIVVFLLVFLSCSKDDTIPDVSYCENVKLGISIRYVQKIAYEIHHQNRPSVIDSLRIESDRFIKEFMDSSGCYFYTVN